MTSQSWEPQTAEEILDNIKKDKRAEMKRKINEETNSEYKEIKLY